MVGSLRGERLRHGLGFLCGEGEQEVLGGDVLVLEVGGFFEGSVEHLAESLAEAGLLCRPLDLGQPGDETVHPGEKLLYGHAHLVENREDDALLILKQRGHEVNRQRFRVAVVAGQPDRALDRFP